MYLINLIVVRAMHVGVHQPASVEILDSVSVSAEYRSIHMRTSDKFVCIGDMAVLYVECVSLVL